MAGSLSNLYERKALDYILGMDPAATRYLALYTSDPTDADSGTECTGSAYARVAIAFNAASTNTSGTTSATNDGAVTFPRALGSWGTISHFGIRTASSGGDLIAAGDFDTPTAITTNQIFEVGDEGLTVTMA